MMSNINRNKLQRAILDKLDDPLFSCVQATPEELSDFAILNIERNNDLDRMVENLRIFMGDTAHAFCKWLLSYVGPELHNLSNDAELQLSVNSGLFNDQDIDMADNQHYRHVNRSWTSHNTTDYHKDFVSDDEDNDRDVRRIPSVVTTTRYTDQNRRTDVQYDRGATHLFLRAVGEANSHAPKSSSNHNVLPIQCRFNRFRQRSNDSRLRQRRNDISSEDLRHRINNARRFREFNADVCDDFQKSPDYGGDTRGTEDDIRTNNIRTRLTRFQATLTNHTLEYNSPEAQKRKSDAIENEHNSIRKKKIRCKFWPKCARGDTCEYVHPSENCNLFPECKYGNTCLYIHPDCPNDGTCSTADCKYSHKKIQRPVISLPQNPYSLNNTKPSIPPASTVCFYDAACRLPGCHRLHPSRTKFTCRSAFKWVNPALAKKPEDSKLSALASNKSP